MKDKNSMRIIDIDLETNVCQTFNRAKCLTYTINKLVPSISYWTYYIKKSQKRF